MFGRIRASSSLLDTLDGSPSKILKDDSFSVYEATLMKLKLGAQRDTIALSKEADEIMDDSSACSSCVVEANLKPSSNSSGAATANDSQHIITSPSDEITMMETDYCSSVSTSPSSSEHDSAEKNSELQRQNNVSILRFFKLKDPGNSRASSCGEAASTKGGSSGSVTSSSVESHHDTSEMESMQSLEEIVINL